MALPSMSTRSGGMPRAASASHMARWVALRMLYLSISWGDALPMPMARAILCMVSKSSSLRFSDSALESFKPGMRVSGGRITAAATTGPARGPRPGFVNARDVLDAPFSEVFFYGEHLFETRVFTGLCFLLFSHLFCDCASAGARVLFECAEVVLRQGDWQIGCGREFARWSLLKNFSWLMRGA